MSDQPTAVDAFDQGVAEVPSCALDEGGVREQRARYARLGPSIARLEREPEALLIVFKGGFDRATLDQALDVERTCCPFFQFEFIESERLLRTTVRETHQLPALDAIARALGSGHQMTGGERSDQGAR